LIIEDDPDTAMLVAQWLDRGGYQITVAATGSEGLARLQEQPFSLVVLDVMLPGIDGFSVCRSIKSYDPLLPVLFLSARTGVLDKVQGLDVGANDYMTKPFDGTELRARVKAMLRTYESQVLLAQYGRQLQSVSEIAHRITSLSDLDNLLWEVIRLTLRPFEMDGFVVGLIDGDCIRCRLGLRDDNSDGGIERIYTTDRIPAEPNQPLDTQPDTDPSTYLTVTIDACLSRHPDYFRSKMMMPIRHDNRVIGALVAGSQKPDWFRGQHRQIMEALEGHLSSAVANARLIMAQRREMHVSDTMLKVAQAISDLHDVGGIAQSVAQVIAHASGVSHCAIAFWRKDKSQFVLKELFADSRETEESMRDGIASGDPAWTNLCFQAVEPVILHSPHEEPALARWVARLDGEEVLVAPILRSGLLLGSVLIVGAPTYCFDSFDRFMAAGIAHQLAAVLEHAPSNRLNELLAHLSHELRSPLAAIKGFVSMLTVDEYSWDDTGRQAFLDNINESADQLGRLIDNVLETSRLDEGVVSLRKRSVALSPLFQRTVQSVHFFGKDHEFEVSVAPDVPEVAVDPLRIEQVLRNLLENAVKFSPPGSKIRILAERQAEDILVSVVDQGIGIREEHQTRIFDRFYQADQMAASRSSGVGLGLHICRELVTAHGGRIWSSSELGRGTTLFFTLPLNALASNGSVRPAPAREVSEKQFRPTVRVTAAGAGWEAKRILVVDDDLTMLNFLETSLEAGGYEVVSTRRGLVALEILKTQSIHLVLLDLILPDLDGFQVCRRLRDFSVVPVIMLTARRDETDRVRGLNTGADDYLVKPITQKEILARVQALLRRVAAPSPITDEPVLHCGDLALDFAHRQVSLRGTDVDLSPTEYKLLNHLAANAGRVLTHQQLLSAVWGPECMNEKQYLWVNISRLRRKLEENPDRPQYILTEPSVGYRFRDI
jgi:two-component system KDP operon response regulator KdpE